MNLNWIKVHRSLSRLECLDFEAKIRTKTKRKVVISEPHAISPYILYCDVGVVSTSATQTGTMEGTAENKKF